MAPSRPAHDAWAMNTATARRPAVDTILVVTSDEERHAPVRRRAVELARDSGSTVILWARDADISPLESPLPTDWSGDGEQEQFGNRLGPRDLEAAGREPLARQIGELRASGVDAWAWLPETADADHLVEYARQQGAGLILASPDDRDLVDGVADPRVESVPA